MRLFFLDLNQFKLGSSVGLMFLLSTYFRNLLAFALTLIHQFGFSVSLTVYALGICDSLFDVFRGCLGSVVRKLQIKGFRRATIGM